ncbi:hypothetical protein AIOL_003131 [Candidatus Rhodobacter oscarellae]|uniref:Integral membrane protein n=1 Tax=Candidatus Rhodobacter oscarellae TaxID=1675527 RepID=A0A0J9E5Y6_9RHOB|nr:DUF1036 domain-containing protein [Candidatus Rhodobacter lobularis]KMW58160.1 hypothetical protein AIOL_003131 [Candidatus Rhodobacter lobularis]
MRFQFVFIACIYLLSTGAAHAELTICNDTDTDQSVSVGYKGAEAWTSEGWWNIKPGECVAPIAGDLTSRYFYLRAEVNRGPFEGGRYFFCTSPEAYTIVGDSECAERGYDKEDFLEIDIGEGTTSFTYRMTQEAMDVAQSGEGLGLEFCNDTEFTQALSVGYEGPQGPTSEGWWNIEPGACTKPLKDVLTKQLYYYRAEISAGEFNGQSASFCTTGEAYTIPGNDDCEARGYVTETFSEIDTGETSKGFTFRITAETGGIPPAPAPGTVDEAVETAETVETAGTDAWGLEVCNATQHIQAVSIGYQGPEGWTSEGWWNIDPEACVIPIGDPLEKQYYYYRAEIDAGDFTIGNYNFCTTGEAYTIVGDTDCEARGYVTESFAEIDIGAGTASFSFVLTPELGGVEPAQEAVDSGTTEGTAAPTDDNAAALDAILSSDGAGLRVCNMSSQTQSIAFGYEGAEGWTSEGWWVLDPKGCATPALDGQRHRYVYYRAEIDGGDFTGQSYFFCTETAEFTIVGDGDCVSRGYAREDFREIDLGTGTELVILDITDANGGQAPAATEPETVETPQVATTPSDDTTAGGAINDDTTAGDTTAGDANNVELPPAGDPTETAEAPEQVPLFQDLGRSSNPRAGGSRLR